MLCQEVAEELVNRGHQLCVLTSTQPGGTFEPDDNRVLVYRQLNLEVEAGVGPTTKRLLFDRKKRERDNLNRVRWLVSNFEPDIVLIWGMWNVPRAVPALVEKLLPGRVAYYICDYWLSLPSAYIQQWQIPAKRPYTQWLKTLLSKPILAKLTEEPPINLRLEHPICVSQALRELLVQAGVPISHARAIHLGIHVDAFRSAAVDRHSDNTDALKLIFVGRLSEEKGVHTIIRALDLIMQQEPIPLKLDVYGKGNPDFESELRGMVKSHNLSSIVSFRGIVPLAQLPTTLARSDVLVFSSEWDEPFSRIVPEAMAAGLVVIGTTTGGTTEILAEGETGLTYPAGDAGSLADQVRRLYLNPGLMGQLRLTGQQHVIQQFRFSHMVDQLETFFYGYRRALKSVTFPPSLPYKNG